MCDVRQTYPTDLNCTEWALIADLFPRHPRGRPPKWELWLIVNAILYVVRTGCQWRMLRVPVNFPPWQTVYGYFWRWSRDGRWARVNERLVRQVRQQAGRDPQPSAAVIDSQSVKTSEGGEARGVDVHKQTNGRKRHIVVDTLGLLLVVLVHSAGVPDGTGGAPISIAVGDGSVWVGNWHNNSVSRIDPTTNQVVGVPIPIGFRAGNIATGHGSAWVTSDYRRDGSPEDVVVVRIDPQTNRVVETIPVGGHPIDVDVTEKAIWVSVQSPDRVLRINP